MRDQGSELLRGKLKKFKRFASFEAFEMKDLKEQFDVAVKQKDSQESEGIDTAVEKATTALWAAEKSVKKIKKKAQKLLKEQNKAQKLYVKLVKTHDIAGQRLDHGVMVVEALIAHYEQHQKDIFTVSDSVKSDLTKENILKLIPKLTADIKEEPVDAAGGYYGLNFDSDSDSDYDSDSDSLYSLDLALDFSDEFAGGATKSRLFNKYYKAVDKIQRTYENSLPKYEEDTKKRNNNLIKDLKKYLKILKKLSGVNDLVRQYLKDSELLNEASTAAHRGIVTALNEWKRTTEDGINKDRKKIAQDMEGKKQGAEQAAAGFFW